MLGLGNEYHPQDYWFFDFRLTSNNTDLRRLAASLLDDLGLKTGRLDEAKLDFDGLHTRQFIPSIAQMEMRGDFKAARMVCTYTG